VGKLTIAFGSFMLGVFCTALGVGKSSPMAFARTQESTPGRVNSYIPVVVPLGTYNRSLSTGNVQMNQTVLIDGRNSVQEMFDNSTLVYGGGSFRMEDFLLTGTTNIQLIGAAANTAQFLEIFGLLNRAAPNSPPSPPQAPAMNTPIHKTTKTTIKGDFVSPYDGKQ
jgi:hypothetical protein